MTILDFIEKCENLEQGAACEYWHFKTTYTNDFKIYWRGRLALHCNDYKQLRPVILAIYNTYHLEMIREYKVPTVHLNTEE